MADLLEEGAGSPSFGVNAAQVWQFLTEIGGLDWDRAIHVSDGRAAADAKGYARSLEAAEAVARKQRPDAWLLAREAASVAVRGKLGDSTLTDEVVDVVGNAAGAIVIRDLLSRRDFKLLLLPWTWRAEPGAVSKPTAAAQVAAPALAASARHGSPWRQRIRSRPWLPAAVAIGALIAVGTVLAALNRPEADLALVGPTDAPLSTAPSGPPLAASPFGTTVSLASPSPIETGSPTPPPVPKVTPGPIGAPTPAPAPTRAPTRTPSPTTRAMCKVISLLDIPTVLAQQKWNDAGFSGTVVFSPAVPPHYVIKWQSLAVGSRVACTHNITVRDQAP